MEATESFYIEPGSVHIEILKKDLEPADKLVSELIAKSEILMLGESNHLERDAKGSMGRLFNMIVNNTDKRLVVFLEAINDSEENLKHWDKIVRICKDNNIDFYPVDTANTGNNSLQEERDTVMAETIKSTMKEYPDYLGVFIAGSNHCNKEGAHSKDIEEQYSDGHHHPNTAEKLKPDFRVGSIYLHFMDRIEALARTIDNSEEMLALPGKHAGLYASKTLTGFGKVSPLRHKISKNSFDLIAFVPTLEKRIYKEFGGDSVNKIKYFDEEIK